MAMISWKPVFQMSLSLTILLLVPPVCSSRPLPEPSMSPTVLMAPCTNHLTPSQPVVLNNVFIPPNATRPVPISLSSPTLTIQFVVSGTPVNAVYNSVPVEAKLVLGRRRPVVLELRSSRSGDADIRMEKPPSSSLGREVWEFVVAAARFWCLVLTTVLLKSEPKDFV